MSYVIWLLLNKSSQFLSKSPFLLIKIVITHYTLFYTPTNVFFFKPILYSIFILYLNPNCEPLHFCYSLNLLNVIPHFPSNIFIILCFLPHRTVFSRYVDDWLICQTVYIILSFQCPSLKQICVAISYFMIIVHPEVCIILNCHLLFKPKGTRKQFVFEDREWLIGFYFGWHEAIWDSTRHYYLSVCVIMRANFGFNWGVVVMFFRPPLF